MSSAAAREFLRRAVVKSADLEHRATIQRAVTTYDAAVAKGKLRFADWEAARTLCAAIKADAIANLAQYLTEFEQQITARGGHVHWAENAEQANDYVVELAKAAKREDRRQIQVDGHRRDSPGLRRWKKSA